MAASTLSRIKNAYDFPIVSKDLVEKKVSVVRPSVIFQNRLGDDTKPYREVFEIWISRPGPKRQRQHQRQHQRQRHFCN